MVTDSVTAAAVEFIEAARYEDLPQEALDIARRCMIDTIGLYVAGTSEESVRILIGDATAQGGRAESTLLGSGGTRVPTSLAARVLGTSGHAHDWDDTQVSEDPAHVYGLLTHPSVPALTAALLTAERQGITDGRAIMLAFNVGFEVECKISEWMKPLHYRRGHHSSGTVGIFGACVAAATLMGLKGEHLAHAIGIAVSLSAGIRVNFGTMTKPLHVGRACENGVTAAVLASQGYDADQSALDGRWGFFSVMGEGADETKVANEHFGAPLTIVSPGVSIKPYPSGILTHQSMDAMLSIVEANDIRPEEIEAIRFYAGQNIIEPIRYALASNHLQAKFSMQALLSMVALRRRASHHEFTDDFVRSDEMQSMQKRTEVINDPAIDARGYDRIRSRIEIVTRDRGTFVEEADERYRGGPSKPLTDEDLQKKYAMCVDGRLGSAEADELYSIASHIETGDPARLMALLGGSRTAG